MNCACPFANPGAVALAFNRIQEAEKDLREVIRSAPDSDDAAEAHGLLMYLYMRAGLSRHVRAMPASLPVRSRSWDRAATVCLRRPLRDGRSPRRT